MSQNSCNIVSQDDQDAVKKQDENGYAEKFKDSAKLFFDQVNEEYVLKDKPVHFKDIVYLDGYFIFEYGPNSVVHFRIDECPGWLFGIWWTVQDKSTKDTTCIKGEFFAQYEEIIDKFKPSASIMCANIHVSLTNERNYADCYDASNIISCIINEPHLAFYRDYVGCDYNYRYVTREEAKQKYDEFKSWKINKDKYSHECSEKILSFIKEKILPLYKGATLFDNGDNVYPKYDIVAPFDENTDMVDEPGCYDLFDDNDELHQSIKDGLHKLIEQCEEISDKYEFFLDRQCYECITFIKENANE